jgi:hypothetical protein
MPELISAKRKVGVAAAYMDGDTISKCFKQGFRFMNHTEFRAQLRKNFRVELTNKELGAIVMAFDTNGDRTVDIVAFQREFFKLGRFEQRKSDFRHIQKEQDISSLKQKIQKVKAQRVAELVKTETTDVFTKEDEKSAIEKIACGARSYDRTKPKPDPVQEFVKNGYVTAVQFRELLRRNFKINLTPAEVAATMNVFDPHKTGKVETKLFIFHFIRILRREKDNEVHAKQRDNEQKIRQSQDFERKKSSKYELLTVAKMKAASEEDFANAEKKLRLASEQYTTDKMFAISLRKILTTRTVTPTAFRELLKNNLNVILSPGELDAVVKMFPTDGKDILCQNFLQLFTAVGHDERLRREEHHRAATARRAEEERQRIEAKNEGMLTKTETKVVWPVLDLVHFEESELGGTWKPGSSPAKPETAVEVEEEDDDDNDDDEGFYRDYLKQKKTSSRPLTAPSRMSKEGAGAQSLCPPIRMSKKPSVVEILKPTKILKRRPKSSSMLKKFPNVSSATKDFLQEVEEEEKRIRKLKKKPESVAVNTQPVALAGGNVNSKSRPTSASNMSNMKKHPEPNRGIRAQNMVRSGPPSRPGGPSGVGSVSLSASRLLGDDDEVLYDDEVMYDDDEAFEDEEANVF